MRRKGPRGFADLASLPEDQRCAIIAARVADGDVVSVIVETSGKADRYMAKVRAVCAGAIELDRGPGPLRDSIMIKVGLGHTEN